MIDFLGGISNEPITFGEIMETVAVFDACDIFPMIKEHSIITLKEFQNIGACSKKLLILKESPICVDCGSEGTIFHLQKNEKGKLILNLFTLKGDREVMMTIDHIIPLSKGGKDSRFNLQTMCFECNVRKGNKIEFDNLDKNLVRKIIYDCRWTRSLKKDIRKKLEQLIQGDSCGDVSELFN